MYLKRRTRFKIAIVEAVANWLGIPIKVMDEMLPEVMRRSIDHYIEESAYLLEHVFDQNKTQVWRFQDWAYDFLLGHQWEPFVLHDHPFSFAAGFIGLAYGRIDDMPRLHEFEVRHYELIQTDETYKRKYLDGWRTECGLNRDGSSPEPSPSPESI